MGIEVVYDRQYVAVNECYIPVFLWGNSNLTTTNDRGREVIRKDWENWPNGTKTLYTREELIEQAKIWKEREIGNKCMRTFSHEQLERHIINGMDYAQSIEWFNENHIHYSVTMGNEFMSVNTTAELESVCVMASLTGQRVYFSFYDDTGWRKVKASNVQTKPLREGSEVYCMKDRTVISKGFYVENVRSYCPQHTRNLEKAIQFHTEADMQAYAEENKEYIQRYKLYFVKVKKDRMKKSNQYFVLYNGSHYFKKKTKGYVHYSYIEEWGRKFKTEKEALKYLEKYPHLKTDLHYAPLLKLQAS